MRLAEVLAADVLASVAERFAGRVGAAGRTIEIDVPDGLRLSADGPRLEQALGNMVANALHHGDGVIRLNARQHDGRVELHVLDDGLGFTHAFLPRAFERFSRPDEARSGGGGAGLGLAIAQEIATAHGGSAHAANRSEGGTDVWLSLPG